jgi:hypothetical protein
MNIQIRARTEGLACARRLAFALNHIVSRIVVRLSDVNGPRGGVDKRCASKYDSRAP